MCKKVDVVAGACNDVVGPCPYPTVAFGGDLFIFFRGDFLVGDILATATPAADGLFVETVASDVLAAWATGGLFPGILVVDIFDAAIGDLAGTGGAVDEEGPAPAAAIVVPLSKS